MSAAASSSEICTEQQDPKNLMLYGPITCSIFTSQEFQKSVIILGDKHVKESSCSPSENNTISISNLIDQFVRKATCHNTTTDVFIELDYEEKSRLIGITDRYSKFAPSHLTDVVKNLNDYLLVDKTAYKNLPVIKDCKIPLRVHYNDVRAIFNTSDLLSSYYIRDVIYKFESGNLGAADIDEFLTKINTYRYMLTNDYKKGSHINRNEFLYNRIGPIMGTLKIDKQLKYIPEPIRSRITNVMRQFFEHILPVDDYIDIVVQTIGQMDQKRFFTNAGEFTRTLENLLILRSKVSELDVLYMDYYTIFRMFRIFRDGHTAKNIIIYAGNLHANNYQVILNALGFSFDYFNRSINPDYNIFYNEGSTMVAKSNNYTKCIQCLNMKGFKAELFPYNLHFYTRDQLANCPYIRAKAKNLLETDCFSSVDPTTGKIIPREVGELLEYNFIRTVNTIDNRDVNVISVIGYNILPPGDLFNDPVFYLYNVCTTKEAYSMGLAKNLIQWSVFILANWYRNYRGVNIRNIYLDVYRTNTSAKAAYTSLGFVEDTTPRSAYNDNASRGLMLMYADIDYLLSKDISGVKIPEKMTEISFVPRRTGSSNSMNI